MVLTEAQVQEIATRVAAIIRTTISKSVGQIPSVDSLEGISLLPAVRFNGGVPESVTAPVSLLQQVATDSIEKTIENAEQAITDVRELEKTVSTNETDRKTTFEQLKTESENATANANAAANRVDESITDISQEKQAAIEATDKANVAAGKATTAAEEANAKALLANLAAEAANAAASLADEKAALAGEKAELAEEAAETIDTKMQEKINALIANAPEALDTLVELAAALGNDPNFATTMATELGKKINKVDIVNDLVTGGSDKVASAETVKTLDASKIGSLFFTTISKPMTSDEFGEIITPDAHTLYIVTLPDS
ncbi:hypothetical protein NN761_15620 [Bacteroides clarus]|uniref:hypothetical protein n=1 Tax=Bacteroides clarus TaxID=626929 RepID=UPI002100E205|nr:hypothetical protein [Bacteroides clarus]MCQ1546995.1 hypothetical protein [Bacteroides clarus]